MIVLVDENKKSKIKLLVEFCIRFVRRSFWQYFRVRFDVDKMLKKQYKKHKWNKICCENNFDCVAYVSCGPDNMCEHPCPACLFWSGYGLKHDIDNKCHEWVARNFV